jgi:hypothetical protein
MVRSDTKSNEKMIGDHTVGLGYQERGGRSALRRNRQFDMLEVIDKYPRCSVSASMKTPRS